MNSEQAIALYLQLSGDIRTLWFSFGGLAVLFVGWLVSRKGPLRLAQRLALTIGWLSAAGYLGASLAGRYGLITSVVGDIAGMSGGPKILRTIADLSPVYQAHGVFVWGSVGAITVAVMLLVWSSITSGLVPPKTSADA